jgi:pimeloyl-ACP methyl ester carboxylesterase
MKLLLALWLASSAFAKDSSNEQIILPLEHCEVALSGASLALEVHRPASEEQPTFLMIPGLFRALHSHDKAFQLLTASGAGVVSMNFTRQPLSVAGWNDEADPNARVSLEMLTQEVDHVRRLLRERGLRNIIPVPLSFGAAVSASMTGFDMIVDLVPMTSSDAQSPELQAYRRLLQAAQWFNPVFGQATARIALNQAYQSAWNPTVRVMQQKFQLPPERRGQMVTAGAQLSRAAEGFTWDNVQIEKSIKRVVILAGQEAALMLKHQKQTLARLMSEGYNITAYIIEESDHDIFEDQPETLVKVLLDLDRHRRELEPALITIKPSTGERVELTGADAIRTLK